MTLYTYIGLFFTALAFSQSALARTNASHLRAERYVSSTPQKAMHETPENTESFHFKLEDESGQKKQKQTKTANKKDTDRKDLKKSIQRVHYEGEDDEMHSLKEQDPARRNPDPNPKKALLTDTKTDDVTSADVLLHHIDQELAHTEDVFVHHTT